MKYRILADGEEKTIYRDLKDKSMETDNIEREGIIRYFLDEEGATDVQILEAIEEDE